MASRPGQPATFLRALTTPLEPHEEKGFWRKGGILSSLKRLVSRKVVQEPSASNSPAIAGLPADINIIHVQSRQMEQLRHSCSVPQLETPSSPSDRRFSNLRPYANNNTISPRYHTNPNLHSTSAVRPVLGHLGGTQRQYSPQLDLFASDPAISPVIHCNTSSADLSPRRAVMHQVAGSSMRAEQLQAGASPLRRGWTHLQQSDQLAIQRPSSRQGPQLIDVLQSLPEFTELSAGAGVEVAAAALSGCNACATASAAPAALSASRSEGNASHGAPTWLAGLAAEAQACPSATCPRERKAAAAAPTAAAGDPAQSAAASVSGSQLPAVCPNLPPGMRRLVWSIQDYTDVARLFKSSTSAIYKATCVHSGLRVALKVYSLDRVPANLVHTLVREVRIHAELSHRAVLTLYGVFQEASRLVLVLERAARGDLYQVHRRLLGSRMSEAQLAGVVLAPLLDALVYLHARGVCHRDIKPENLLLAEDWTLRLADFGSAINLTEERAVTRTGTSDYMAPEVERCPIKLLPQDNKHDASLAYTTAADIWSLGVLAFEMLCGFPPLSSTNPYNEQQQQQQLGLPAGESHLRFPAFVSPGARDFIATCLAERPGDRHTAAQLLRHPWLKSALAAAARTSQTFQRHSST